MKYSPPSISGFTIVELIVVVTILIILSTIGFVSYNSSLLDARNSTRITDMWNLKMALKNHKFKNGLYPLPGSPFQVTNSGAIIQQWLFNDEVYTKEIDQLPQDPLVKTQYYFYATTHNKLFFQIGMSQEDQNQDMIAYVDGDYKTPHDEFVPSILFASDTWWTLESLSGAFIVQKWTYNLPYNEDGQIVREAESLTGILQETGVSIPKFYGYYSCEEIYENGASMGSGVYMILDTNSEPQEQSCDMNY